MKHVTYLLFILSMARAGQFLQGDLPENEMFLYIDTDIWPSNLRIPNNPYWQGISRLIHQNDTRLIHWRFDWIKFKRNITEESLIKIDYMVLGMETDWLGNSHWEYMYSDSDFLCDTENLDSNVGSLVRQVLGIPEGCPVLAGDRRKTSGLHFPLNVYRFFLKKETIDYRIRLLTTVRATNGNYTQPLFTGTFDLIYPAGGGYV